ncbi:hypothetical protein CON62_30275, partial [Bacillus toyonensis]
QSVQVNASKHVGLCELTFSSHLKVLFHTFIFLRGSLLEENDKVYIAIAENKHVCISYQIQNMFRMGEL